MFRVSRLVVLVVFSAVGLTSCPLYIGSYFGKAIKIKLVCKIDIAANMFPLVICIYIYIYTGKCMYCYILPPKCFVCYEVYTFRIIFIDFCILYFHLPHPRSLRFPLINASNTFGTKCCTSGAKRS